MEPIKTVVTHVSDGSEEALKVFRSMTNSTKIHLNAMKADQVMFTEPGSEEGFSNKCTKIVSLGITAVILVTILSGFQRS